jgi:FtsH-binding integral membrane protein
LTARIDTHPTSDKEEEALVTQHIRAFLLVEVVAFAAAALVHFGLLVHGYEHRQARVAESVITLVLVVGLVLSWLGPTWTLEAGLVAQGFALLGTLVGSFTIMVGVGPRTAPDVVYHIAIMAVLVWGLLVAMRSPANSTSQPREVGS